MSLSIFPRDILKGIALYLSPEEICALGESCKYINKIMKDKELWIYLFKRDFLLSKRGYDKIDLDDIFECYKTSYLLMKKLELQEKSKLGVVGPRGLRGSIGPTNLAIQQRIISGIIVGLIIALLWKYCKR